MLRGDDLHTRSSPNFGGMLQMRWPDIRLFFNPLQALERCCPSPPAPRRRRHSDSIWTVADPGGALGAYAPPSKIQKK